MDTTSSRSARQPLITVLTPTYNRADLLPRLYESLRRQTDMDFEWILVDDGSGDDTETVVQPFLHDAPFAMRYLKKANGGKHTAVNLGVREARGELIFIADSDDMLTDTSIADVTSEWKRVCGNPKIGGLAGFDINMGTGEIIGSGLPQQHIDCNAMDIRYKHHVTGDLKEVFRTSVLLEFPFPEIEGERFCPEQLCWFRIAQKYDLHYFSKGIYIAEYQNEGLTAGITRARAHSPIASCTTYAEMLGYAIPVKEKVKAAINYWRFRCCAQKGQRVPRVSPLWWWAWPLGWAFYLKTCRK